MVCGFATTMDNYVKTFNQKLTYGITFVKYFHVIIAVAAFEIYYIIV